jgi:hypothetical protein
MALPLGWYRKPGCARFFSVEERAGGIEGEGPAGAFHDRKGGKLAGQSGERLPVHGCCGAGTV